MWRGWKRGGFSNWRWGAGDPEEDRWRFVERMEEGRFLKLEVAGRRPRGRQVEVCGEDGRGEVSQTGGGRQEAQRKTGGVSRPEGRTTCTLIPGDGVGPELVYSVQEVFKGVLCPNIVVFIRNLGDQGQGERESEGGGKDLKEDAQNGGGGQEENPRTSGGRKMAAGIPVDFEPFFFSEVNPTLSAPLEDVAGSITRNGICLKGILSTPDYSHTGELQTLNMKLRNELDLYANVVHVKSLPGIKCRHQNVDAIIIREQTEGEYSALEHECVPGVVECLKIVTRQKSKRIAKFAFDYATKNNRKKVTAVHKANIMKLGDGLFLKSCQEVGGARHTFSEAVGKNVANPTAMLLCGAKMLNHVNLQYYGDMIRNAINRVLKAGKVNITHFVKTKDLGGQSTTNEFTYAVIHNMR
uniref:Isopropylmalate dehydrogenase-like domain-containing protein n=1 Tax=Timema bartmani TaxID=61472 RepID=A0A7R9EWT1_9NEOP|nr:unnamed protein product [Timema bartmani]